MVSRVNRGAPTALVGLGMCVGGILLGHHDPAIAEQKTLDYCRARGSLSDLKANQYFVELNDAIGRGIVETPAAKTEYTINAPTGKITITYAQRRECEKLAKKADDGSTPYEVLGWTLGAGGIVAIYTGMRIAVKPDPPQIDTVARTLA